MWRIYKSIWKLDSNYKADSSSYLFNFTNKKIINIKNSNEAIYCDKYASCFGNYSHSDFYISLYNLSL